MPAGEGTRLFLVLFVATLPAFVIGAVILALLQPEQSGYAWRHPAVLLRALWPVAALWLALLLLGLAINRRRARRRRKLRVADRLKGMN